MIQYVPLGIDLVETAVMTVGGILVNILRDSSDDSSSDSSKDNSEDSNKK